MSEKEKSNLKRSQGAILHYQKNLSGEEGPCDTFDYNFRTNPFFFNLLAPIVKLMAKIGWNIKVKGTENIPKNTNYVFMPNHISHMDAFLVGPYFTRTPIAIGDEKLFRNKLFNQLVRLVNAFPVRKGTKSLAIVEYAIARINSGDCMLWFPEGQRHKNPLENRCNPGKTGSGMLAHSINAPIIPIFISGAEFAMGVGKRLSFGKGLRSIKISVEFGKPVPLDDLRAQPPSKEISKATVARIIQAIEEMRPKGPYLIQNRKEFFNNYKVHEKYNATRI